MMVNRLVKSLAMSLDHSLVRKMDKQMAIPWAVTKESL
jgi:hypothetical protein